MKDIDISTSAVKSMTMDNFAPIKLRPQEEEEYMGFFFPKSERKSKDDDGTPKKSKPMYPAPGDLLGFLGELRDVADRICALYYALGITIKFASAQQYGRWHDGSYGSRVLDQMDPIDSIPLLTRLYSSCLTSAVVKSEVGDKHFKAYIQNFLRQPDKSRIPYIVKESKSGFDIVWAGTSGTSRDGGPLLGIYPTFQSNYTFDTSIRPGYGNHYDVDQSKFETKIAKDAYANILLLNNTFTNGLANNVYDIKRGWKFLPLNFNFEQLNEISIKTLGIPVFPKGTFSNISNVYQKYSKFFSIAVVYTPNENLVRFMSTVKDFDKTLIPKEILVAQPNIHFSIAMHLPNHIAEYITQTPSNQKVSYSSLCQWLSAWVTGGFSKSPTNHAAKYVVKASDVAKFVQLREQSDLFIEKGPVDEHNIFISNSGSKTGRLIYCSSA